MGPVGRVGRGPGGGTAVPSAARRARCGSSTRASAAQAGWLLGVALVVAVGLVVMTRLRRADARTGWLIAVGGAFAVTLVAFSRAQGIFHPYYVSLLAPFTAALVGAGVGEIAARRASRASPRRRWRSSARS